MENRSRDNMCLSIKSIVVHQVVNLFVPNRERLCDAEKRKKKR